MRIIKLSEKDEDMLDRSMVDVFFKKELPKRNGGRFHVPKGFISSVNFPAGEQLVFSYKKEIIYLATAKSGILATKNGSSSYPYYFLINIDSITEAQGRLEDFEVRLAELGVLVNVDRAGKKTPKRITSRGWPYIPVPKEHEAKCMEIIASLKSPDSFYSRVQESLRDSTEERDARLKSAPRKPKLKSVSVQVYERSPDVVAKRLIIANGICECCGKKAPFIRKCDDTPYLEVHHIVSLANNGDDTVENTAALCPNCHRRKHFGK